ncbi:MAG: porin family protein [Deltaproteobacteria bacterium]|nr:porin family protein [Deltaproteobacteria bacterium]
MKQVFSGFVLLGLMVLSVPSLAADLKPYNWTGFYFGVNGGYGWGETDWDYAGTPTQADHEIYGVMAGGTAGANLQLLTYRGGRPAVVGGIEVDFDLADIDGSGPCPNPRFRAESSIDALATVRGRLGIAFDRLLVYGTGGLALGKVDVETFDTWGAAIPPSGTPKNGEDKWRSGYVAGVGVEYAFWKNISLKVEYQYYDLGKDKHKVDNNLPVDIVERGEFIRGGINYKF